MSRLTNLIAQARTKDPALGTALEAEFHALSTRRQFGLNFERHQPEAVELPGRPVRKGDKVRVLAPRGETERGDHLLWRVTRLENLDGGRVAHLAHLDRNFADTRIETDEALVVVAEFLDPIYPGLRSTGRIQRGGEKPFHTVINSENFHALQTLLYTHKGKIDAIYIDPPYNTGAKDWKYNNDYVDGEDAYRHSKWLAFMERRLRLAGKLLNPHHSVLIVTIDEKEYLRLGLLLEQTFPQASIQMVTSAIKPSGSQRADEFSRVEEYLFFVRFGSASPALSATDMLRDAGETSTVTWQGLRRRGSSDWRRIHRPNGFYPVFINEDDTLHSVGEPIPLEQDRATVTPPPGTWAAWPLAPNGDESRWQVSPGRLREQLAEGTAVLRSVKHDAGSCHLVYLKGQDLELVRSGAFQTNGRDEEGKLRVLPTRLATRKAKTMWVMPSHDASAHGTALLTRFLDGRKFPFPKSLYAVEDALWFFIKDKPDAVVLDFFAGSGTTAHAVMRLNTRDGGRRQSISVTNNEVSAEEQNRLRLEELRPGDPEWEALGICDYITKPRLSAAVTGQTPEGNPVDGDYRFNGTFPMTEGMKENVEFFTLTYETPWRVARNRDFDKIAPLLWLRAGSQGHRIDQLPSDGFAIADTYGVIADLDRDREFQTQLAVNDTVKVAYIITDDDRRYQMVAASLPEHVEAIRLYESYLNNFEINTGRE